MTQVTCVTESKFTCLNVVRNSYIAYLPAVILTVGIAVVSLIEAPQMPVSVSMSDKVIHGIMYVLLAMAWMVPVSRIHPTSVFGYSTVCLAVTAFGALMEILQRYCTLTRSGEMADLYADFLGALVGVGIIAIWRICTTSR